jgi:hypothetical protein
VMATTPTIKEARGGGEPDEPTGSQTDRSDNPTNNVTWHAADMVERDQSHNRVVQ